MRALKLNSSLGESVDTLEALTKFPALPPHPRASDVRVRLALSPVDGGHLPHAGALGCSQQDHVLKNMLREENDQCKKNMLPRWGVASKNMIDFDFDALRGDVTFIT